MTEQELMALQQLAENQYSDARRDAIVDDKGKGRGWEWLAGIGDAINNAYGGRADAFGRIQEAKARAKEGRLATFDQGKKDAVAKYLQAKKDLDRLTDREREDKRYADQIAFRDKEFAADQQYRSDTLAQKKAEVAAKKAEVKTKEDEKLRVPGLGTALTADDAKKLKDAKENKDSLDRKLQEMIDLRASKGAEVWDREAVERGKQLSKDILLKYKNLAKLGVLSKSDEDIINQIIPKDPLEWEFSSLVGQDTITPRLEKFKADLDEDFNTTTNLRLSSRDATTPKQEKQIVKRGYNAKTDQTQLIYSDGTKEIVDGRV